MTDHWLEDINLENGQLKEALHMAEQKTIDEAERLQQMEARAIAAEKALTDICTIYELWRVMDGTQKQTIDRMRAIGKIADTVDLSAACKLIESAALAERLAKRLEWVKASCDMGMPYEAFIDEINKDLAITPTAALEQYRAEALEEVAKPFDAGGRYKIAAEIRAMKAPEKGGTR